MTAASLSDVMIAVAAFKVEGLSAGLVVGVRRRLAEKTIIGKGFDLEVHDRSHSHHRSGDPRKDLNKYQ
jgi:hypothetical protein